MPSRAENPEHILVHECITKLVKAGKVHLPATGPYRFGSRGCGRYQLQDNDGKISGIILTPGKNEPWQVILPDFEIVTPSSLVA